MRHYLHRREALTAMATAMGLSVLETVFGGAAFAAEKPIQKTASLSPKDVDLLNDVAETILPTTDRSPGAGAANVGAFMRDIVTNYYSKTEQKTFEKGLMKLNTASHTKYKQHFQSMSPNQRHALLIELENAPQADYYKMLKQLTVWGYFSSEAGAKQALQFVAIPGRYDGEIDIKPGHIAWAI